MAHIEVVGQEMAVGSALPETSEVVQGDGWSVQVEPSQTSTEAPTTAVQAEVVGHETPTRPAWYRETVAPAPPCVPNDCGARQAPFSSSSVWPVLSTKAQKVGEGHDTATDRDPGCPGPGSAGFGGIDGGAGMAIGSDQSVPLPSLTPPDPSAIRHDGPDVQSTAGRTGAVTGPPAGAG
jgi:hypothetical protein